MTGLCCRCQVRHGDELCCTHGVIHRGDVGASELLVVAAAAAGFAVTLAVCTWLGYNGSDALRLVAGVLLIAAAAVVLHVVARQDRDAKTPPEWMGPGTFRATSTDTKEIDHA